jgi:hypothetical protein
VQISSDACDSFRRSIRKLLAVFSMDEIREISEEGLDEVSKNSIVRENRLL